MRYRVYMVNTVSTSVEVEAESWEEAIDEAYNSDDMPGSITVGAFGCASVDDGDWMPHSVTDTAGETVWSADE